jgi:hypothetical protein
MRRQGRACPGARASDARPFLKDLHLVTENEDFRLAVALIACGRRSEENAEDHVGERQKHSRILRSRRSQGEPSFGTPQAQPSAPLAQLGQAEE